MALNVKSIKGTQDVLPSDSHKNRFIEQTVMGVAENFGFKEIRTPVFEHTELFQRSVGDTTDVVEKEMYTFLDKGGRSITLRPEGTAGAARAFLEHGLFNDTMPQKVCYLTSCYRYEKPQAGRLREFHQFGAECFGTDSPAADAEIISLANEIFASIEITDLKLYINSIGCPECRKNYHKALKEYFKKYENELCETCQKRLERNPMRILDCKSPQDAKIADGAPVVLDYLCEECKNHFEKVKEYLALLKVEFEVDPKIVRGLDYYTKTVFEFVSTSIGAQGTVCGGGRYDGLLEELGSQHIPALGFAIGLERLMLLMESQNIELPKANPCDIYIAAMDGESLKKALQLTLEVREICLTAQTDIVGRSLKAQMKYADRIGARYSLVLGTNEIESGEAELKNMQNGEKVEISLDNFAENFQDILIKNEINELKEMLGE